MVSHTPGLQSRQRAASILEALRVLTRPLGRCQPNKAHAGTREQHFGVETIMTKAEIVQALYAKVGGLSKKESADIVDLVFEMMKETLSRGEKIKISGFGNFVLRDKRQRPGRNPQTGDPIRISERRVLTFKASQILKQALNPKHVASMLSSNGLTVTSATSSVAMGGAAMNVGSGSNSGMTGAGHANAASGANGPGGIAAASVTAAPATAAVADALNLKE
jgi:integration host factor subunit alpha